MENAFNSYKEVPAFLEFHPPCRQLVWVGHQAVCPWCQLVWVLYGICKNAAKFAAKFPKNAAKLVAGSPTPGRRPAPVAPMRLPLGQERA